MKKEGYEKEYYTIYLDNEESDLVSQKFSIRGIETEEQLLPVYEIVVSWGNYPVDLDCDLKYYQQGLCYFHAYPAKGTINYAGCTVTIDNDDKGSNCVETMKIEGLGWLLKDDDGYLEYSVREVSKKGINGIKVKVDIYENGELLDTIEMPTNGPLAYLWTVFRITAQGIEVVNKVG